MHCAAAESCIDLGAPWTGSFVALARAQGLEHYCCKSFAAVVSVECLFLQPGCFVLGPKVVVVVSSMWKVGLQSMH